MSIVANLNKIKSLLPAHVTLVAVTKTHPVETIMQVYNAGHKIFGENKVQELVAKYEQMPKDIEWHLIGHLQSNKVKYIAPFISLIHSVDSLKLLQEVNKQAAKCNRTINCLLQIYIAKEETKYGLDFKEANALLESEEFAQLNNIKIVGLMGMATNTDNKEQISNEFLSLKNYFEMLKNMKQHNIDLTVLSMGMSADYSIAMANGSNMVRVGSTIFGAR